MADEDVAEITLGLTVAVVARRVGVAPATLRTWERRYGICPSDRSSGGHRRYCITDVARLELMRRLVLSGMPAGEAARVALKSEINDVRDISLVDSNSLGDKIDSVFNDLNLETEFGHPGGGSVISMQGSPAIARADISLHEPVHLFAHGKVGPDFTKHPFLSTGEFKGQFFLVKPVEVVADFFKKESPCRVFSPRTEL